MRPTETELTSKYSMGSPVSACTSNIMPQNLRGRCAPGRASSRDAQWGKGAGGRGTESVA